MLAQTANSPGLCRGCWMASAVWAEYYGQLVAVEPAVAVLAFGLVVFLLVVVALQSWDFPSPLSPPLVGVPLFMPDIPLLVLDVPFAPVLEPGVPVVVPFPVLSLPEPDEPDAPDVPELPPGLPVPSAMAPVAIASVRAVTAKILEYIGYLPGFVLTDN